MCSMTSVVCPALYVGDNQSWMEKGEVINGQRTAERHGRYIKNNEGGNWMKDLMMQTYTVALPILLGYMVWLLKTQKKDKDANTKGTMLLLRVALIEYHAKEHTRIGSIPSYAYENFCRDVHEAYRAMGGNGMVVKNRNWRLTSLI